MWKWCIIVLVRTDLVSKFGGIKGSQKVLLLILRTILEALKQKVLTSSHILLKIDHTGAIKKFIFKVCGKKDDRGIKRANACTVE